VSTGKQDGVTYVTDATPADIGVRVVVRHRLPEGGVTDVLGHLRAWADGELVIESRTGDVRVAEATVLAVKQIPPAPQRRRPGG
jgi:hypothetical protein